MISQQLKESLEEFDKKFFPAGKIADGIYTTSSGTVENIKQFITEEIGFGDDISFGTFCEESKG